MYLEAARDGVSLLAVGWWDKKVKQLIATAGSNEQRPPRVKERRHRITGEKIVVSVNTTAVPTEYFSYAHKVDVHNHYRQGILALEREIRTRDWDDKLAFTFLGLVMVDAYQMFLLEHPGDESHPRLTLRDFVVQVATDLLERGLPEQRLRVSVRDSTTTTENAVDHGNSLCRSQRMSDVVPRGKKKRKSPIRQCRVCKRDTSMVCGSCSTADKPVAICGPMAKRPKPCIETHAKRVAEEYK